MENNSIDLFAPLASLQWVDRDKLHANDYNPNKVSEENLKLLVQSILTNGWTLPIVVRPDYTIIDGFHRWTVAGEEPLHTKLGGKVPVVIVRHDDQTEDIYGTVTHNRARGTHLLEPMKAIVKRLMHGHKVGTLPEDGALYKVRFALRKDTVEIYLDTSGDGLYKRGYRAHNNGAPLRETLAAALVLLSRYRGRDPFCDPFCGSGTIPIEAALIAKNRAPGLDRRFAAQKWQSLPAKLWLDAAEEAIDQEFHGQYDIWGGDIDPSAVELSRHNAELAGVDDCVRFEVADAGKFHRDSDYGQLVTNPPYGERLLEKREAEALYRSFGKAARTLPAGWRVLVLSSHTEFERAFGRSAEKKRKLYNGMLKCDAFFYHGGAKQE